MTQETKNVAAASKQTALHINTKLLVCGKKSGTVYKDGVPFTKTGEGGRGKVPLGLFSEGT